MLNKQDLDFLRGLSIFAGLREETVALLGEAAARIEITEDRLLFHEGEPAKEMAIVVEGRLDVIKRSEMGEDVCIATLGPGDVAGEMSLFDIQPRSANVWARAPATVVLLGHGALVSVYREDTQSYTLLVLNIAREISIRLRRIDTALANVLGHIQSVTRTTAARLSPPATGKASPEIASNTSTGTPRVTPPTVTPPTVTLDTKKQKS